MLDWDKLRIFHTAAESGSFTHAAEKLNMSQSAVSRQISALEEDLGLKLFIRHARGLVLTEVGEQLFRTAHRMQAELQAVETQMSESQDVPTGQLIIGFTNSCGSTRTSRSKSGSTIPSSTSPCAKRTSRSASTGPTSPR
jgi:DNA-binding transcriptional LysR family regulator